MESKGLRTRLVEKGELRVNFQLAFEGLAMLIFTLANIDLFSLLSMKPEQHCRRTPGMLKEL